MRKSPNQKNDPRIHHISRGKAYVIPISPTTDKAKSAKLPSRTGKPLGWQRPCPAAVQMPAVFHRFYKQETEHDDPSNHQLYTTIYSLYQVSRVVLIVVGYSE